MFKNLPTEISGQHVIEEEMVLGLGLDHDPVREVHPEGYQGLVHHDVEQHEGLLLDDDGVCEGMLK